MASGAWPRRPTVSGCLRRAQDDDRVALVDELLELALLGQHPGAGAVDDLQAALLGAGHDGRRDAVGADDDGRARVHLVERGDGPDALRLELLDDALVVHDLAEGMRQLALRGGHLGVVDRLADAVAEAGAARDDDLIDGSHVMGQYRTGCPSDPTIEPGLTVAITPGRCQRRL